MPKSINKIYLAAALLVLLSGLAKSALADPVGAVRALGTCAKYFGGDKQIRDLPKDMTCSFEVSFGAIAWCPECVVPLDLEAENVELRGLYLNRRKISANPPLEASDGRQLAFGILNGSNKTTISLRLKKRKPFLQLGAFTFRLEAQKLAESCESYETIANQRLLELESCSSDADCGKALFPSLENSGVGPVVRHNADRNSLLEFYDQMRRASCYPPELFIQVIYAVDGTRCEANRCAWNYAITAQ